MVAAAGAELAGSASGAVVLVTVAMAMTPVETLVAFGASVTWAVAHTVGVVAVKVSEEGNTLGVATVGLVLVAGATGGGNTLGGTPVLTGNTVDGASVRA